MKVLRKRKRNNLSKTGRKYIRWKAMQKNVGGLALQIERTSQVKYMDNINVSRHNKTKHE